MQTSKTQKAQKVRASDFRSTGRRREALEATMDRVRSWLGEAGRCRWVVRLERERMELDDLEDESGGRGVADERWLKRRLPSIMAAMKVAKMTPKGMWVSEEGEELLVGIPMEKSCADFMAADQ
jgi:hypothetical protein